MEWLFAHVTLLPSVECMVESVCVWQILEVIIISTVMYLNNNNSSLLL